MWPRDQQQLDDPRGRGNAESRFHSDSLNLTQHLNKDSRWLLHTMPWEVLLRQLLVWGVGDFPIYLVFLCDGQELRSTSALQVFWIVTLNPSKPEDSGSTQVGLRASKVLEEALLDLDLDYAPDNIKCFTNFLVAQFQWEISVCLRALLWRVNWTMHAGNNAY